MPKTDEDILEVSIIDLVIFGKTTTEYCPSEENSPNFFTYIK
jgi:hypothetical protein